MKKIIFVLSLIFIINLAYAETENIEIPKGKEVNQDNIESEIKEPSDNENTNIDSIETNNEETDSEKNKSAEDAVLEEESADNNKKSKNIRKAFAMGMDLSFGVANSYFRLENLFKETLEIDLAEINAQIPKSGFKGSTFSTTNFFLDIYLKNNFKFGFFSKINIYGLVNIPKSIFKLAAEGNADSSNIKETCQSTGFIFFDQSAFFGMKIKDFAFRINASWFLPVFYLDRNLGEYEFKNTDDGKLYLDGKVDIKIYSPLPVFGNKNPNFNINEILKSGGFDIDFMGTYEFTPYADLNFAVLNIPILPGKLKKGLSIKGEGTFEIDSLIKYIEDKLTSKNTEPNQNQPVSEFKKLEQSYDLKPKIIFRPLKLVISSDIYPLKNEYLIITPSMGLHCFKPVYIDAGLKIESHFAKILGAYLSTQREDRIWKHKLGFFVNTRAFRLDIAGSLISTNLKKSFSMSGVQVDLGILFGY